MKIVRVVVLALALSGCASQQYWVRSNATIQQGASDLSACRISTSQASTQQVYSAAELESPCMIAKGYALSDSPPR